MLERRSGTSHEERRKAAAVHAQGSRASMTREHHSTQNLLGPAAIKGGASSAV
jgi:hypothetical protein